LFKIYDKLLLNWDDLSKFNDSTFVHFTLCYLLQVWHQLLLKFWLGFSL